MALVLSVKGMLSQEHNDRVETIATNFSGMEECYLDRDQEFLHIHGSFDRSILKDTLETAGFFVYIEPDVECKFHVIEKDEKEEEEEGKEEKVNDRKIEVEGANE